MYDLAIAKFDSDLNSLWEVQKGTDRNDKANGIALDSSGNVFIGGSTYKPLGEGASGIGYEVFIAKYDSTGNEIFIKQVGTDNPADLAYDIAIDSKDQVYVAGGTSGAFEGNENEGQQDAFLIRFDKDGNTDKLIQFGTPLDDFAQSIAIDGYDDVLITGASMGNFNAMENLGLYDIFLLKYDNP